MNLILTLVLFFAFSSAHAKADMAIGALEQTKDDVLGAKPYFTVRAMFKNQLGKWQAYPHDCGAEACLSSLVAHYPKQAIWTIAFDGKKLGSVATTMPTSFRYYSGIGRLEIKDQTSVPKVGQPTRAFADWDDNAYYRPLIAVSKPHFLDPDHWKPSVPSTDLVERIKAQFKKSHPHCECKEFGDNTRPCKPMAYKDSAIKIGKSYGSQRNWRLVAIELSCGERFQSTSQLYAVSLTDELAPAEIKGRLVDAGDYDGDGKSELLFKTGGYNEGGYTLYFNDFSNHIDFKFSFH